MSLASEKLMTRNGLDPEFKKQWVEALRSGKYPQGIGRLKSSLGYCCLGVAEEIMFPLTGNRWDTPKGMGVMDFDAKFINAQVFDVVSSTKFLTIETSMAAATATLCGFTGLEPLGVIDSDMWTEVYQFINQRFKETGVLFSLANSKGSLSSYNDSGVPFSIIADVVEKFF